MELFFKSSAFKRALILAICILAAVIAASVFVAVWYGPPSAPVELEEIPEACELSLSEEVKLSDVLGVDMTEILTGQTPRLNTLSVTRAGKGYETDSHDQYVYKNLAYNFVNRKIEPMYVTVRPEDNKTLVPNSHEGQEFDYILSGTMHLVVGKNDIVLHPGDSAYYDSRAPHAMEAVGDEPVHFLAIVIP